MPLNLPGILPAVEALKKENIFVIERDRAASQDIRPLRIAVLNLMPIKITTETDLIRLLSNTPLQVELTFMRIKNHVSKNTSVEHLEEFYQTFDEMKHQKYDGLIVTGAPLEKMEYEDVTYWGEIQEILDWAKTNVFSSLFICWASQAALYHYYGVPKVSLGDKLFGVFEHKPLRPLHPIFRGFDDTFYVPHSRFTEVRRQDIAKVPELNILAESDEAGVHLVVAREGREFFVTGHSEYSPMTLHDEYVRDLAKGESIAMPKHYYRDNDPAKGVRVTWRSHANLLFTNWLNYFVYQATPYNIDDIK